MQDIVSKVFDNNAEHVLAKFVQYIFEKKLAVSTVYTVYNQEKIYMQFIY